MGADFMKKIHKPFSKRYDERRANLATRGLLSKNPQIKERHIKADCSGAVEVGDHVLVTLKPEGTTVSKGVRTIGVVDAKRANLSSSAGQACINAKVISKNPYSSEVTLNITSQVG